MPTKLTIYRIFVVAALILSSISAALYLINNKSKLKSKYYEKISLQKESKESDKKWAEEIIKGGYLLYFRHAERDKWIDVQVYDALESDTGSSENNNFRFAEKEYFENAVCLNQRGKIQAKSIKEVIAISKLPIGYVVSSPSCRSRQTAEISFGGYQKLYRELVHKGPYYENMTERNSFLRNFLINLPIKDGKNTIISAHNGVISSDLFKNAKGDLDLEEGGFYVISNKNKELKLMHEFHNFNRFSKVFFERNY